MNHFQLLYLQKNKDICKSSFRRNRTDTRGAGGLSRVTWGRQQGGQGRTLWQRRTFCHHSRSQAVSQPNFHRSYKTNYPI